MANLKLYDPFSTRMRMNKLFENFIHPVLFSDEPAIDFKLDLTEDDTSYTVRADMPGVNKEDIKVDVEGNRVSITAESKKSSEQKSENTVYTERYEGRMFRSFSLDHDLDAGKSEARLADGVLTLKLFKKEGSSGKRLTIS